jgi:hypothetical protein
MSDQPPTAALHLRALRALPFATVCVVVSAAGHQCAAGMAVDPRLLLAGWAGVWLLATLLAGRERSLAAITLGLATGELGLHQLFHTAAHAMSSSGGAVRSTAMHLLCGPLPPGTTATQLIALAGLDPHAYAATAHAATARSAAAPDGFTPTMIVGHALAALIGGWWLRRGEAALCRLLRTRVLTPVRLLLALLAGLIAGMLPEPAAVAAGRAKDAAPPVPALLRHAVVRRGPPAFDLAA